MGPRWKPANDRRAASSVHVRDWLDPLPDNRTPHGSRWISVQGLAHLCPITIQNDTYCNPIGGCVPQQQSFRGARICTEETTNDNDGFLGSVV